MSWVVKAWKPELLQAAEREARRVRRAAGREAGDAAAYLRVLEDLGAELREDVRRRRRAPAPLPLPLPVPPRRPVAEPGERDAGNGRARLRDSPLSELFRASA